MSNFKTQVDFSTQVKEYQNTETTLSGSVNIQQYTILGTDYSDLPLGLDGSTTAITSTFTSIPNGYFTGTTGSTTFYFSDPNMNIASTYLSAITYTTSATTQIVSAFQPITTIIVDGNSFDIYFTGVTFNMTPNNVTEYSLGEFSGETFTNGLNYLSGSTYPWWFLKSGSTTWNEIKGRLKTDRLSIIEGASNGYILTSDNDGNATWQPNSIFPFTGGSGSCISDFYVTTIHSCSPLYINPNNEGNIYFGNGYINLSGITIDTQNSRLGINTTNPEYALDVYAPNKDSKFYYTTLNGGRVIFSGQTGLPSIQLATNTTSLAVGVRSSNDTLYPGYGKPGDAFFYSSTNGNGINIISKNGTLTEDYVRLYAGGDPTTKTSDIHIQGSGTTIGYIGVGTENPTQKLHISGNTRVERDFDGDTSVNVTNNNNGGTSTRSVVSTSIVANSGGNTLTGIFATSAYNTDLTGSSFGDGGTGYLKNATTLTIAGTIPGRGSINIGVRDANKFLRFFSGNQNFDNLSLRGSLNSNGYWGFGQNMTGQTATVHIKGYSGFYPLKVDSDLDSPILYVDNTGNVGIGISSPSVKLDVTGKTKTTTLQVTSGATPGYVLTSLDSDGNATWQSPTSGGLTIDPFYQITASTFVWDVSGNSSNYEIVLTGNSTINLINVQNGQYGTLISNQDSVGYHTINFGTVNGASITHKVVNGGGGIPTLTGSPNAIDILTFTFNGTTMFWSVGNSYT